MSTRSCPPPLPCPHSHPHLHLHLYLHLYLYLHKSLWHSSPLSCLFPPQERLNGWHNHGLRLLQRGQAALVTLAGGWCCGLWAATVIGRWAGGLAERGRGLEGCDGPGAGGRRGQAALVTVSRWCRRVGWCWPDGSVRVRMPHWKGRWWVTVSFESRTGSTKVGPVSPSLRWMGTAGASLWCIPYLTTRRCCHAAHGSSNAISLFSPVSREAASMASPCMTTLCAHMVAVAPLLRRRHHRVGRAAPCCRRGAALRQAAAAASGGAPGAAAADGG